MSVMFGMSVTRVVEGLLTALPPPPLQTPTGACQDLDLFLPTSFLPFISCFIYAPCLLSPAWWAYRDHYVAVAVSTSISGPGG